jgi:hypothetical protein
LSTPYETPTTPAMCYNITSASIKSVQIQFQLNTNSFLEAQNALLKAILIPQERKQ